MEKINNRAALYIIVGVVILVSGLNYIVGGKQVDIWFLIDCISKSVLVITIVSVIFTRYLWKYRIFKDWLVKIPYLNGTWKGTLKSDWIDPNTGEQCPQIETTLSVNQSLFKLSCVMMSGEMKSFSLNCGYNINKDDQLQQLSYTYISVPKQDIQERSRIHYGAIIFDIENEQSEMKLCGNYWTGRKTSGVVELVRVK